MSPDSQRLIDRQLIVETLHGYMFAIDEADSAALRNCFTSDGEIQAKGGGTYTIAAYVDFVATLKQTVPLTHHVLSNCIITFEREEARCKSNFVAYHELTAGIYAAPFGTPEEDMGVTLAGRYDDVLVVENGRWRIRSRLSTIQWQTWLPKSTPKPLW